MVFSLLLSLSTPTGTKEKTRQKRTEKNRGEKKGNEGRRGEEMRLAKLKKGGGGNERERTLTDVKFPKKICPRRSWCPGLRRFPHKISPVRAPRRRIRRRNGQESKNEELNCLFFFIKKMKEKGEKCKGNLLGDSIPPPIKVT